MIPLYFISGWRNRLGVERKTYYELWDEGHYQETYNASLEGLQKKPLDHFLLTIHGFSAYQLGVSQINNYDTLTYIDQSIWALRKALLVKKDSPQNGRIYYVLGKAYYYKGSGFADLAVKYLEMANESSYQAGDIPEYLGLSYAAIRDYRSSVAAFTQALEPAGASISDVLLLSIARSYLAMEEYESARAYLVRCMESSRDSKTILIARLLLADILKKEGQNDAAEGQYLVILNESGENAEAHYRLGLIYADKGDTTRARAEWRRAVKIDPAHAEARARLSL